MSDAAPPVPGSVACPRCGAAIQADQDWCLVCGAPARTRLAPIPNWRLPLALLASVVALSLVALVLAFVTLTDDPNAATGATGATGPSVVAPAPTAPTGPSGATGATGTSTTAVPPASSTGLTDDAPAPPGG